MRELHDIFDECVDRLAVGESIDAIVRDYPDHAAELRDLLTLGQLAGQAQINTADIDSAQEAGRSRLADLISRPQVPNKELKTMTQEKSKRKIKPITEARWKLPAIAVAGIALLIGGVLIGLFVANRQGGIDLPPQIALAVADDACLTPIANQNQVGQQTANQMQQTPTPFGLSEVRLTATALESLFAESTPVAAGIDIAGSMPTPMPTGTPFPTMLPPVEAPAVELGAVGGADGDDAVYGYGADTTLPDTGGGAALGGEMPPAAPVVEGRTSTAVTVPESVMIVPTSVASLDRDYSDEAESAEALADGMVDVDTTTVEESLPADYYTNAQQQMQPLQAGEIDDNADWDVYQAYRNNYFQQYSPFSVNDKDVTDRQIINVVDESGLPVLGACVQIYMGESLIVQNRTFATGLTMFFPNMLDNTRYVDNFNVVVSKNGIAEQATLNRNTIGETLTIELPFTQEVTPQLDVMFLVDTTGSMADEIQQLQDNILSISSQIDALPGNVSARYGLVAYKDFGDEYVTKTFDFVADVHEFQSALMVISAGGGGDTPEALNEGLNEALNVVQWRDENTVKLIFIVADAAPHIDYNNGLDYSVMMLDALARGIKMHPIASSGLEPDGEYMLRQMAQATMGHFIFLTYEGSVAGTPGEERTDLEVGAPEDVQGVGDYSVAQLDEVVLRLITDELAALQPQQ
jgi:hypothetical protein